MSIRWRLSLILALVVSLCAILYFCTQRFILLPSFVSLERDQARRDIERCRQTIYREIGHANSVCKDWATFDDVYRFALDHNRDYVKANLTPSTFATLGTNLIFICDNNGRVLFGQVWDLTKESQIALREFDPHSIPLSHSLMKVRSTGHGVSGLFTTERGPMIVAAAPILTSDGKGPSRGVLMMGRFLDNKLMSDLRKQAQVNVQIFEPTSRELTSDERYEARHAARNDGMYFFEKSSSATLRVFGTLPLINSSLPLLSKAELPRNILSRGGVTLRSALYSIVLVGSIILLVMLILVNRVLLRPMLSLTNWVLEMRKSNDLAREVPFRRKDEIGRLAVEFKGMLDDVSDAREHLLKYQETLEEKVSTRTRELKEVNEHLQKEVAEHVATEKRFRTLFDSFGDMIFICSPDGSFLEANLSACEKLGYERRVLLSLGVAQVDELYDKEHFRQQIQELHEAGELAFATTLRRRNGTPLPVEIHCRMIEYSGGETVLAVARDISERREAEAEKAQLEAQLRQSQKMDAIGLLAGGIAHDFNNLLTPIIGYGEEVLQCRDTSSIRAAAVAIVKAGERASTLTRQLLAFSRKQVMQPRVLDLNALILNLQDMLRRIIGEDIELRFDHHEGLGFVKADPGQLEQVIMNLAVNARDAMPQGGILTIETANYQISPSEAHQYQSLPAGDCVLLKVSDTGSGMSEEVRSRIFEPFFSTKGARGTGLGLSTVYGIVKQSGGGIICYSMPDQGTSFEVFLPLVDALQENSEVKPQNLAGLSSHGETVLLVEDEDVVRVFAGRLLKRLGYTVISAAGGEEALQASDQWEGKIDLLLTDVVMPAMSGREVAREIQKRRPSTKIVYMSGYTNDIIAQKGILEEGTLFLEKPFTAETLAQILCAALDGSNAVPGDHVER